MKVTNSFSPLAIPWDFVGHDLELVGQPPFFLWEQTVGKQWAMDSQDLSGGRGGLPKGLKQFLETTPVNKSKSVLPWKLYEADTNGLGSACGLYHCPGDNIIKDSSYFQSGCGGPQNLTFSIWWDNGVEQIAQDTAKVAAFAEANGNIIDFLVLDIEHELPNWTVQGSGGECARMRWQAIEGDPRWPDLLNQLKANGFVDDGLPDLLVRTVGSWGQFGTGGDNYLIWNSLMSVRVAEYYNASMWLPMRSVFPAIQSSDYSHAHSSPEHLVPDRNGHRVTDYGSGNHVGTHQGQALYGHIGQLANSLNGLLVAQGQAFEKTAFNAFLYDVQTHLSWRLASPRVPTAPWICNRNWIGDSAYADRQLYDSPYHAEVMIHLLLQGVGFFNYWNVGPRQREDAVFLNQLLVGASSLLRKTLLVSSVVTLLESDDDLLAEVGNNLEHSHAKLMNWTTPFVLTGAFLNFNSSVSTGTRLWRFSPDEKFFPDGLSATQRVQSSILSSSPAILAAGPWSVRLPASRVLEPGHRDSLGLEEIAPQGVFVTQPTSKKPVYNFCQSGEWDECGQCVSDNHPSAKCSSNDQQDVCFCDEFEPEPTSEPTISPKISSASNLNVSGYLSTIVTLMLSAFFFCVTKFYSPQVV